MFASGCGLCLGLGRLASTPYGLLAPSIDLITRAVEFDPARRPRNAIEFVPPITDDPMRSTTMLSLGVAPSAVWGPRNRAKARLIADGLGRNRRAARVWLPPKVRVSSFAVWRRAGAFPAQ